MALALSADRIMAWTRYIPSAAFAIAGLALIVHGVRYLTLLGRIVLPALAWSCALSGCSSPGGVPDFIQDLLVPAQDRNISFRLCLGARHASPVPVRPVDELRMEGAFTAFDLERGDHESGDRMDATMSVTHDESKPRKNEAMTLQIAVFLILAAVAVAGAVSLILQRHPIHSALSLIVS